MYMKTIFPPRFQTEALKLHSLVAQWLVQGGNASLIDQSLGLRQKASPILVLSSGVLNVFLSSLQLRRPIKAINIRVQPNNMPICFHLMRA
ncbi:hypothetical protein SAY87_017495 [Trapa incisa]|uniref:Uncharacterized protein n=1 Tax=Trapa incisa TaxID=236973 RepID=A0AAN7L6L6_9MYRT|nr:hypothetical protein SAY87_017495 [Trapa incisa]